MSAKSGSKNEYVEFCLDRWSEWSRTGQTSLGYPKSTPVDRLMREGSGAGQVSGAPSVEMPELVQQVELAVRALPEQERQAIKLKYIKIYLTDNARAKEMRMSRARFFTVLDRARWFIRGRMG